VIRGCCNAAESVVVFQVRDRVPAEQLARATVDHQTQGEPALLTAPYPAQVVRSTLVRLLGPRHLGLDPRALAKGAFAHLPGLKLEDPLDGVLVQAEQRCDGAVAK